MKVLVCGGRDYADDAVLRGFLNGIHEHVAPITLVIHGACSGADTLAARWAIEKGVDDSPYPADWKRHGKAAGPLRNQQMLDEAKPNLVVAFPGGRGTADMVARAKKFGFRVIEVSTDSDGNVMAHS